MAYAHSQRIRKTDPMTSFYYNFSHNSYDQIIEEPELYLLSQSDLFSAEGSYAGLAVQLGVMGAALAGLFTARPQIAKYFLKGSLRFNEWALIAGTGFISYRFGYWLGHTIAGDSDRINHHYAAFYLQKSINRYDGRVSLMKKPMMF